MTRRELKEQYRIFRPVDSCDLCEIPKCDRDTRCTYCICDKYEYYVERKPEQPKGDI